MVQTTLLLLMKKKIDGKPFMFVALFNKFDIH